MKQLFLLAGNIAKPLAVVFAFAVLASFTLIAAKKRTLRSNPEKRIAYGPSVVTHNLHNTTCVNCNGATFEHGCFDKFCYGKHILTVHTDAGYTFTGSPFVNCVTDNDGSCGWNNFAGAKDRFIITERDDNKIVATVYAGSRQITIQLACEETKN